MDKIEQKFGIKLNQFVREKGTTGIYNLDLALNILRKPFIMEIYGPEASLKTTTSLIIANNNSKDSILFVDLENKLNEGLLKQAGVEESRIIHISPTENAHKTFAIVEELIEEKIGDFVIIDSIPMMLHKVELDYKFSDETEPQMARGAYFLSLLLKRWIYLLKAKGISVIFINQVRDNIGGYFRGEKTPGGKILRFLADYRIRLSASSNENKIVENGELIGVNVDFKIIKNSFYPQDKKGDFCFIFGKGLDSIKNICDAGITLNIIRRDNNITYSWKDNKLRGKKGVYDFFNDESLCKQLKKEVDEQLKR